MTCIYSFGGADIGKSNPSSNDGDESPRRRGEDKRQRPVSDIPQPVAAVGVNGPDGSGPTKSRPVSTGTISRIPEETVSNFSWYAIK